MTAGYSRESSKFVLSSGKRPLACLNDRDGLGDTLRMGLRYFVTGISQLDKAGPLHYFVQLMSIAFCIDDAVVIAGDDDRRRLNFRVPSRHF